MAMEMNSARYSDRSATTAGREFSRKFCNLLIEIRLQAGIHNRIEKVMGDFAEEHPNLRASYISRDVDDSYFNDGSCGWEALAKGKLQGLAIEGDKMYEFLAFANGFRMHATPLETVMNVEELWLESAPSQPFAFRVCLYHSFPATTILTAPTGEGQDAAVSFVQRLKYLRGF